MQKRAIGILPYKVKRLCAIPGTCGRSVLNPGYYRIIVYSRQARPTQEPESLIGQRQSVFDNDEFDVFSRETVDTDRIHKGKKYDS